MFNYSRDAVLENVQQAQAQADKLVVIDGQIGAAAQLVQDGAWTGIGATAFLEDTTRFRDELKKVHAETLEFIGHLSQAANSANETITKARQMINNL